MKKSQSQSQAARGRGERGAALITTLLMTTLLLSAGGALIITTGMSATTAADSTAEMQAYYAAEAGLESALAVIRRQVPSVPAGTTATFRQLVCGSADPCNNTGRDFSTWLTYTGSSITLTNNPPTSYALTVRDAALATGLELPAFPYSPRYLVVTSTGFGPKGARKVLEMTLDRLQFTYDAPAALVLRESDNHLLGTQHVTIDVGSGGPSYSGQDRLYPSTIKGAVGVGSTNFPLLAGTTDFAIAKGHFGSVTTTPTTDNGVIPVGGPGEMAWPSVVSSTQAARDFVAAAADAATYVGCPPNNRPLNGLTFIGGNCSLASGNAGAGMIVATGELTLSGDFSYEGLIFVLGSGSFRRNGAGTGTIFGGVLAANFGATGDKFGPVVFNTNGGGGSLVQYDSVAIENALALFGPKVLGVVEK